MEGVETRHQANCNKKKIGKRSRCNCQPSYRAWISDKKNGGELIKRAWTQDKSAAENERRDLEAAQKAGALKAIVTAVPSLDEYARDVFLPGIESGAILSRAEQPYRPGVVRGYIGALENYFLDAPELKGKKLHKIDRTDLDAIVARMRANGLAAWTIKNKLNALRALYRHALYCKVIPDGTNPTSGLALQKGARRKVVLKATGEKGEMVIRGAAEVLRMIDALPTDEPPIFAVAALAGLRRGELQALKIGQVDLEANRIHVRHGWDSRAGELEAKTDAGLRDIPILKMLRPYLERHLARLGNRPSDRRFFTGTTSVIDPNACRDRARDHWTQAGLEPLGLHDARHTFASMMIASGANIKQISHIMGHSSITITLDTYGHLLPGSHQEAADKMDAWLERTIEGALAVV